MKGWLTRLNAGKVVVWGLKFPNHTHYFIHRGFYDAMRKLGVPVTWVSDSPQSQRILDVGDVIIAVNVASSWLPRSSRFRYCLHNCDDCIAGIEPSRYIRLQVMTEAIFTAMATRSVQRASPTLEGVSGFDSTTQTLYQSWGTPTLQQDFRPPVCNAYKNTEFFVGSIWNNDLNQGNESAVTEYRRHLRQIGLKFVHAKGIPEKWSPLFVRQSVFGAAIVGDWQRVNGYTPCRLFKAVSWGQLGSINSASSGRQYPWAVHGATIEEAVNRILSLRPADRLELIKMQQSYVASETYEQKVGNILACLCFVSES